MSYFFAGSVDDDGVLAVPLADDDVAPLPAVPVPVVPVALVPGVEPGVVPEADELPVPDVPAALEPVVVSLLLLDAVPLGVVVDDDDEDVGGGGDGVTTVVDEVDGVVPDVAGGVSCCWQAESASRTLAATAVRIGRFIVAPS